MASSSSRRGFAMDAVGQSSGLSRSTSGQQQPTRSFNRSAAFDEEEDDHDDGFQRLHNGTSSGSRRHPGQSNGSRSTRTENEMLTGYSKSRGAEKAQRSPPRSTAPRVIAKQSDLNWMEERKRRLGLSRHKEELGRLTSMRTPGTGSDDAKGGAQAGADVQGEETKDRIGDEKQLSGLQIKKKEKSREEEEMEKIQRLQEEASKVKGEGEEDVTPSASQTGPSPVFVDGKDAEEEAARAALLSGQGFGSAYRRSNDDRIIPISEEDALKIDTESRPEAPTMSDYAKMPVEEFGAALLRGMGWKEGTGAGKNRQGPTSAPEVKKRAALLGLGAKERQLHNDRNDDPRNKKNFRVERPERRYIPVIKREREVASESNAERQVSTSSPPSSSHRERERERERRPRERSRSPADRHEHHRRRREEEADYDRRRDDKYRSRSDRAYEEEKEYDDRRRRERERERDRDYDRDRHSRHSRR